jgi:shikimate dehydrogenase
MGSLSPVLFADAFAAAGIDGFYHLLDVDHLPGRRLPQLLDAIKTAGFAGTNITYPFKQDILPLLDAVDPEAAQVGAINTVAISPDGRTTGYNFDRRGWRHSFEESLGAASAQGATVVLVGAGGAGHAVSFALMDLGVALLVVHDRDGARANALCGDLARHFGASRCRVASDLGRESPQPTAWSMPRKWVCADSPAIPCRYPRLSRRIGPPTSSIRQSIPSSSRPRLRKAPAC